MEELCVFVTIIPAYFSTNAGAVPVIHCKPPVSSCSQVERHGSLQLSPAMYYKGKSTSRVGKTVLRLQVSQTEEPSHVKQPASCAT